MDILDKLTCPECASKRIHLMLGTGYDKLVCQHCGFNISKPTELEAVEAWKGFEKAK